MTTSATSFISEVQTELQDASATRWSVAELVAYLNEANLLTVTHRPDTNAVAHTFSATAGALQTIPATAIALVDVDCNHVTPFAEVTRVAKEQLDSLNLKWQSMTQVAIAKHYTYDPLTPRVFYVYPPMIAGTELDIMTADYPALVPSTPSGNLPLPDWTVPALKAYVKYKAWSKDAEVAGNAALASAAFGLYQTLLGLQLGAVAAVPAKT